MHLQTSFRLRSLALTSGIALLGVVAPVTPAQAATIEVNTTLDVVNFSDGLCSLREAVLASSMNNPSGMAEGECASGDPSAIAVDVITLPPDTYTLTIGDTPVEEDIGETGDLDIYDALPTDFGGGTQRSLADAHVVTIEGNGSVVDASGLEHFEGVPAPDRAFHVLEGFGAILNDLTIQGGGGPFDVTGDDEGPDPVQRGGAILVDPGATLIVNESVLRSNQARDGGAVYNDSGHVELNQTVVGGTAPADGNIASQEGGGIYTASSLDTLILEASSVSRNFAGSHGGGIYSDFDSVSIEHSEISGNTAGAVCGDAEGCEGAGGDGGGVWILNGCPEEESCEAAAQITNSTISGNRAVEGEGDGTGRGGGVALGGSPLAFRVELDSSTIVHNRSSNGGNLHSGNGFGVFFLGNSIVAGGLFDGSNPEPDNCGGPGYESMGFNLVDTPGECGIGGGVGDITGTNPLLGPLSLNPPGNTRTHALLPGSPAIDAGAPPSNGFRAIEAQAVLGFCPEDDQRGVVRPIDGDFDGEAECDIGAFERRQFEPTTGSGGGDSPPVPPGPPGSPPPFGPPNVDPNAPCTIVGTSGPDSIVGTPGHDVICLRGGNDQALGDPPGSTSPRLSVPRGGVGGNDIIRGGPGKDRIRGGPGHDLLRGYQGKDRLRGGSGRDLLSGAKGRDSLFGQGFRDSLIGGKGPDRLRGGAGRDRCRAHGARNKFLSC